MRGEWAGELESCLWGRKVGRGEGGYVGEEEALEKVEGVRVKDGQ